MGQERDERRNSNQARPRASPAVSWHSEGIGENSLTSRLRFAVPVLLLVPQCHYRINLGGSPRRNITGAQRYCHLSATVGSTDDALRAGMKHDKPEVAIS